MSARSTMGTIIKAIRRMTSTNPGDYSINSVNYWADDQIQEIADQFRVDIVHEQLMKEETWVGGGTIQYLNYLSKYKNFEGTSGGTAIFIVEDGTGNNVTNYSVDYFRGKITFDGDTSGTTYYLTGRSYNLEKISAEIWRAKAAYYAADFDFSTDGHNLRRSQILDHCLKMAEFYESQSQPGIVTLVREDDNDVFNF